MIRSICEKCKNNTFYDFKGFGDNRNIIGCFNTQCAEWDWEHENVFENIEEEFESILLDKTGFCGCGMPKEALFFLRDFINLILIRNSISENQRVSGVSAVKSIVDNAWEEYKLGIKNLIINNYQSVEYIIYYLLADKNIFEHGGSVPGWLEDKEFKEMLDIFCEIKEKVDANLS